MLISFVIPVFNAERTISHLCRSLVAELGGSYALDIILVDDNSRDNSEQASSNCKPSTPTSSPTSGSPATSASTTRSWPGCATRAASMP